MIVNNKPVRWVSKGGTIVSKSAHHHDLFIISNADGIRFHAVTSSVEVMLKLYPQV